MIRKFRRLTGVQPPHDSHAYAEPVLLRQMLALDKRDWFVVFNRNQLCNAVETRNCLY